MFDVFADIVKVCQMDHILMWYTPNDLSQRDLQYGTILIWLEQLPESLIALEISIEYRHAYNAADTHITT